MNTETITLYKDGEEIVVDVQRVEEFMALGYAATVGEGQKDKDTKDKPPEDEAKADGKGRGKGGK